MTASRASCPDFAPGLELVLRLISTPLSCDWCQTRPTCGFHAGFSGASSGRLKDKWLDNFENLKTAQGSLTFVSKLVSTYMTLEWAFPCVPAIVVLQFAPRLKTFLADITHKSEKVSVLIVGWEEHKTHFHQDQLLVEFLTLPLLNGASDGA